MSLWREQQRWDWSPLVGSGSGAAFQLLLGRDEELGGGARLRDLLGDLPGGAQGPATSLPKFNSHLLHTHTQVIGLFWTH